MTEAYRSAFLRTLAWASGDRGVHLGEVLFLAARACPIDFELWPLRPSRRPGWWPYSGKTNASIDVGPGEIWQQIALLWERQYKSQPLEPNGAIGADSILASANGFISWG